jgi:hypothetical protein
MTSKFTVTVKNEKGKIGNVADNNDVDERENGEDMYTVKLFILYFYCTQ